MLRTILFLVILLSLILMSCTSVNIEEGIVAHKSVTGVKNDTSYTILVNKQVEGENRIQVKDDGYSSFFSGEEEDAVINESLEAEMRQEYSRIDYLVNIRLSDTNEDPRSYRVSREIFNALKVGSGIRFRASEAGLPEITEVLEEPDAHLLGVLEGTVTIGPIWPVESPGGHPPIPPEVYEARKILVYDEHRTEVIKEADIVPGPDGDYGYYRAELKPGTYTVDINHIGIDSSSEVPRQIELKSDQTVVIDIDIDTGIR
jgi:hypothetical protein